MGREFGARLSRLGALLGADGFDTLLVSDPANIRYLTGFTGTFARLVHGPDATVLLVDRRYRDRGPDLPAGVDLLVADGIRFTDALGEALAIAGGSRVGFEPGNLSWYEQGAIAMRLPAHAGFHPAGGHVEELRAIKDECEIAAICLAARTTDQAISAALDVAEPGVCDLDVGAALAAALRSGGDGGPPAFEPLVTSGAGTARIHGQAAGRALGRGDLLLVDAGATREGMAADCARTIVVGAPPDRRQRAALERVQEALDAAIAAVAPGVPVREVARAAERVLARAGFALEHDLGHGVGLEVHEAPRIAGDSDELLEAGMVLALEPGIYLPGWGGVRLEDMVAVTASGARILTAAPRVARDRRF